MKNSHRIMSILTLLLFIAEAMVVVGSWIGSVIYPDDVTSMLSSEGVRWFVGSFTSVVATPLLVNIVLVGMSYGLVRESGIIDVLRHGKWHELSYTERLALQMSAVTAIGFVAVILLLTFLPHAVLLNAHGSIFGSSFSRGILPMLCYGTSLSAAVYGLCSQRISYVHSFADALISGIRAVSPLILLYILGAQLYFSVYYVLYL